MSCKDITVSSKCCAELLVVFEDPRVDGCGADVPKGTKEEGDVGDEEPVNLFDPRFCDASSTVDHVGRGRPHVPPVDDRADAIDDKADGARKADVVTLFVFFVGDPAPQWTNRPEQGRHEEPEARDDGPVDETEDSWEFTHQEKRSKGSSFPLLVVSLCLFASAFKIGDFVFFFFCFLPSVGFAFLTCFPLGLLETRRGERDGRAASVGHWREHKNWRRRLAPAEQRSDRNQGCTLFPTPPVSFLILGQQSHKKNLRSQ